LVVLNTNSQVAAYTSAPYGERREAPPAALYLGRLAPNTRGPARYRLEKLAESLSAGRATALTFPWESLTYSQVMNLRVALERQYPDSPGTRNNYLISLRAVLRECWALGLVEERTYRRLMSVPLFPVPKHGPRPGRHVELDEVRTLIDSIRRDSRPVGIRDLAIVAALFGAGLRRSEVVALTVADWTGEAFTIRNGKGGKSRTVPVPTWAAAAIDAWLELRGREDGVLFTSYRGSTWNHGAQHMRPTSVRDILNSRLLAVGHVEGCPARKLRDRRGFQYDCDCPGVAPFRCHDARRTYIGENLDAGNDIATVADLVGHADIRTTRLYDKRDNRRMAEAVAKLPDPFSYHLGGQIG
jgi:integrase/recombinase XerD